jgi:hypothetical protein
MTNSTVQYIPQPRHEVKPEKQIFQSGRGGECIAGRVRPDFPSHYKAIEATITITGTPAVKTPTAQE